MKKTSKTESQQNAQVYQLYHELILLQNLKGNWKIAHFKLPNVELEDQE
jgi:hypothetical protein